MAGILDGKWAAKIPVEDQLFPVPVDHFRQQKKGLLVKICEAILEAAPGAGRRCWQTSISVTRSKSLTV